MSIRKLAFVLLLMLAAVPAQATITVVAGSVVRQSNATAVATITCTLGASAAVGDLVFMWYVEDNPRGFISASDDGSGGSNTYVQDLTHTDLSGGTYGAIRSVITHSGTLTITVNVGVGITTSVAICGALNSTTGWPASPLTNSDTGSNASAVTASQLTTGFITTQATEIVLLFTRIAGARTVTNTSTPIAFSDLAPTAATNVREHSEYAVTAATGTFQSIFTWTSASPYGAWGVAYKDNVTTSSPRNRVVY